MEASGFTITAMPSWAMTVAFTPLSESLSSRETMPMSQVPSVAMFTPVVESDWLTSMATSGLRALYASASFSMTGVTDEEPAMTILPDLPEAL